MAFARVNSCHTVSILLDDVGTSTHDNCGNLLEDSDYTEEDMEVEDVEPNNWV